MTRWRPDTCGCEIEYDENLVAVEVFNKCAKHSATADHHAHLAVMLAHNRKKNTVHNAVADHLKSIGSHVESERIAVQYDADDDLHVIGGVSNADQLAITSKLVGVLGTSALNFKG